LTALTIKDGLLDSPDHPMLDFFADRSIAKSTITRGDNDSESVGHDFRN
jgi:hypothetical protein